MAEINCRYFNGYKPCGLAIDCNEDCSSKDEVGMRLLVVHLGAMGAVLRSSSLIKAMKRKYPKSHITWVTQKPSHLFFENNPYVDKVITFDFNGMMKLKGRRFDIGFCIDKSAEAYGVIAGIKVDQLYGFKVDSLSGAIVPATSHAEQLWDLGLSNHQKFFVNKKPETHLVTEALNLKYQRDDYEVYLNKDEVKLALQRKTKWAPNGEKIIGLNTGCSPVLAYKKLSIEAHRELITKISKELNVKIVLLGGPEDTQRNIEIAKGFDQVILSPTEDGIRDGFSSVEACDVVVSGDSLGMHMAIALKKWVIAWFGPTCSHEIDLFDRGVSVLSQVGCGPCWKRSCQKSIMCYDQVDLNQIVEGIKRGLSWRTSSYKQLSSEI